MPEVTAAVIAKDEELSIERCLASVQDLVEHRLVYDTGSTDKTIDIASRAGAETRTDGPWKDFHFAKARNRAAELAPSDWILVLDADEILAEGGERIQGMIKRAEEEGIGCIRFRFEEDTLQDLGPRLYHRRRWAWRFAAHNELYPVDGDFRMLDAPDIVIRQLARGDEEHDRRRWAQTMELLEQSVEENPDHIDAHLHLCGMYSLEEKFEEALAQGKTYIEKAVGHRGPLDISQAWCIIGEAQAILGEVDEALSSFGKAHSVAPARREPFWKAAVLLGMLRRYREGAAYVKRALSIPRRTQPKNYRFNHPMAWDDEALKALLMQLRADSILKSSGAKGEPNGN